MPLRIYYLDDEKDLCEIFTDIFSSPDVAVETFQEPTALERRVKEIKPDLLLLDYRLPGTTGDVVASKLDPSIPKVLITGDIRVKTNYPFLSILEKPITEEQILSLLKKYA